MAKDYYKILGVEKNASKEEIKKAFRKLAHQHHPDKQGGDEKKFKEINEAYTVLSDDNKRAQYDSFGQSFNGGGPSGFEGFDFSNFDFGGSNFDFGDIFGDIFRGGRERKPRGRDIAIDIEIDFKESIFGVSRSVLIHKDTTCDTCKGTGGKPGTGTETCNVCNGSGQVKEIRQSFFGSMATVKRCSKCHGTGSVPKEKCHSCGGDGIRKKEVEIKIDVPAGIEDGQMLKMPGLGEVIANGVSGDLYVKVHVRRHKNIEKENANLIYKLKIKLSDAVLGGTHVIESIDGAVEIKIPSGTKHGERIAVKGRGVPMDSRRRGDFVAIIDLEVPKHLSKKAKEAFEKLREEGV